MRGWNILLPALLFAAPVRANDTTIVIHDESFILANWELINRSSAGVSVSTSRIVGGGVTGDARFVNVSGLSAGRRYHVDQYKLDATYLPDIHGDRKPQTRILWEVWYRFQGPGQWGSVYMIARQAGREFFAPGSYREPQNQLSGWQQYSGVLTFQDFIPFAGVGADTLATRPGSPPIQFGYRCFSTIDLPSSVTHQVSFLTITLADLLLDAPAALSGREAKPQLRITSRLGREVQFMLAGASARPCELSILDLAGRVVARQQTVLGEGAPAHATWDRRDLRGSRVAPGVFLARVRWGQEVVTGGKFVLLQ